MPSPCGIQVTVGLLLCWQQVSVQAATTHTMLVHGADSYLDGRYVPSELLSSGHRCYEKDGREDVFLCKGPSGYWLVQPESQIGSDVGYLMSSKRFLDAPLGAGPWKKYQGESMHWMEQRTITVEAHGKKSISLAIALMAVGSLVVIASVVKLALAWKPEVRDMFYLVLCSVFTTFMAYTTLEAILILCPRDSCLLELVLSFVVLASSWGFMSVGSWKCQFNFHRVASICWLSSCGAAYGGIAAASAAQRLAMAALKAEMQPRVLAPKWVAFSGVFAVSLLTFMILGIFRSAANYWRLKSMQNEPAALWCNKKSVTRYGCWPFGESQETLVKFTWKEYVKWGEDVAGILIGSFTLYQTMFFPLTERLPGIEDSVNAYGDEMHKFEAATGLAAMIVLIAVALVRTLNLESLSRFVRVCALSVVMVGSWCCMRLLNLAAMPFFPDGVLASTVVAFMAALVAIVAVCVIGSHLVGATYGWGVCTLAIGIGNVCGVTWGRLFQSTMHSTSEGMLDALGCGSSLAATQGFHFLLSASLVAVAFAVWFVVVLPRRNLGIDDHRKMIHAEQASFIVE